MLDSPWFPPTSNFGVPLAHLGITPLELYFRSPLEKRRNRMGWPPGSSDREREGFDMLAAGDWLGEVAEETGSNYAIVVSWCLMGNRTVPAGRGWEEMLREVVIPLQRCLSSFKLAEGV
ncbi:hypothetical protein MCOR25_005710 [Pyricularia grisea]|uniref:Uncharacterized protein n=1 Tax=Pyricularia grisea TaxID=148305 RepID=A0A6P8B6F3_PYRGI|nr:hypothetical protein PgNI_06571 [Pyricularia grisea]KAI6364213.1 hypothetical protein MCOR25_005710 [Pyricularia grisea]TLD10699.1 hypothetical protein PgNI_06571 [Pyricularia grisea]